MKLLMTVGQSAFEWAWQTSVYATLLIVLVFALQRVLARWLTPRLRYVFSLLILVRLLLPVTPFSTLSVGNLLPPGARPVQPAIFTPPPNRGAADFRTTPSAQSAAIAAPPDRNTAGIKMSGELWMAWAMGGLSLLLLAGWRLRRWNCLIKSGRRMTDPQVVRLLDTARRTMNVRRPIQLVAVPELNSPAVFGIFQTRLLLSESMFQQLNDGELRMIFLHEMAHVRRNDILLNYLIMGVQFLHWFNPFVWLALHRLRADRELVCDAMVIRQLRTEEHIGYGKVLLKLMDNFQAGPTVFFGAAPVIGGMSEMKERILMIKHHRPASLAACLATALTVGVLAFTACTRAPQKQPVTTSRSATQKPQSTAQKSAYLFFNGGPVYHGHPAGYWIFRLKQGSCDEQSEAREALRSMGKAAVPFFNQALLEPDLPNQERAYAASALGEMGPVASEAIPSLVQMTNQVWAYAPRAALMKIRGEPIEGLIRALNEPVSDKWAQTAQILAEFGPEASEAIPALCRGLDSEENWAASYAIGFIHSHPEIAVPALIVTIKQDHSDLAPGNAIWALGEFEAEARPAIPTIRLHLQDPDSMTRQTCLLSLHKILPPDEVKTLVPDLLKNVNDPNPNLRMTAQTLLKEIDPKVVTRTEAQP